MVVFVCIQLLKAVIYQHMESEEFVCEMLSTLTLHKPYPAKFHQELLKMLQEHLESREDQVCIFVYALMYIEYIDIYEFKQFAIFRKMIPLNSTHIHQGEFWKNAHTRMCMRIAEV